MEFLENRRSWKNQSAPVNCHKRRLFLSLASYNAPSLHIVEQKNRGTLGILNAQKSGKEKAHKHKQIFRVARGLLTGGQGSKVYVLCAEPKEHKHFRPGTRPGGSVAGVTEKLCMCQMFMRLFRPLKRTGHFSTPNPQVCCFYFWNLVQKEKSLLRKPGFPY